MASTSNIGVEIRKFDGKNFALWKEMMKDVLIIGCQIEAIKHNNRPSTMTTEEWWSLEEITRSTIRTHLVENVYFSMAKELTVFDLWEKLQSLHEKKLSFSKLIFIRQLFNVKKRERAIDLPCRHL